MPWTRTEEKHDMVSVTITRPRILQNGMGTERRLLGWIRALSYAGIFGLLTVNLVLYLWQQRGNLWKDRDAEHWGVHAMGVAVVMLGSSILVLGAMPDGVEIRGPHGQRRLVACFALAAILGMAGLIGSTLLLVEAWPR